MDEDTGRKETTQKALDSIIFQCKDLTVGDIEIITHHLKYIYIVGYVNGKDTVKNEYAEKEKGKTD